MRHLRKLDHLQIPDIRLGPPNNRARPMPVIGKAGYRRPPTPAIDRVGSANSRTVLRQAFGSYPYLTGIRIGAPWFLTSTAMNLAGSVRLAFRPTMWTSSGPSK